MKTLQLVVGITVDAQALYFIVTEQRIGALQRNVDLLVNAVTNLSRVVDALAQGAQGGGGRIITPGPAGFTHNPRGGGG